MSSDSRDVKALADEYVLGLMETAEALQFEAVLEGDDALQAAVAESRERFLPLDTGIEPVEPSEGLWSRIETSIRNGGDTLRNQDKRPDYNSMGAVSMPANDNNGQGWRVAALSGMVATILLAVGLVWELTRVSEPVVVAVLLNEAGEIQAVVEDFGNENATVRLLQDVTVPSGKTIQVWTLPSREMGPVSLGLLEGSRSAHLGGPPLPAPRNDQLYELTLEQAGGSPTGRPTGPILAKGFARQPL